MGLIVDAVGGEGTRRLEGLERGKGAWRSGLRRLCWCLPQHGDPFWTPYRYGSGNQPRREEAQEENEPKERGKQNWDRRCC